MGLTPGVALLALQVALVSSPVQTAPPPRQVTGTPWTLRIGPQRPDLVRYNRVEGLSLGARVQVLLSGTSHSATVRVGLANPELDFRLEQVSETLDRRIVVSEYLELAAIDERARHFGVANSLMALVAGQDDGDYYRRAGLSIAWTPPTARPRTFRVRGFAEIQGSVAKETDVQLARLWDDGASFRPNIDAEELVELGGSLELARRWGTDPTRMRGGIGTFLQTAATIDGSDWDGYARYSLGGDVSFALPARLGLSVDVEGGASWGSPSRQRLWYLGGPLTVRGYEPLSAGGQSFGRGRAELARSFSFGRFVLFADAGWAGLRSDIDLADGLASAGAGLAVIDGILRIDGAWRLDDSHRFRLDVYLDQIL